MANQQKLSGLVLRLQSGFYAVQTEQGIYTCQLRGRLKRGRVRGDIVAVGDRVQITPFADGTGAIELVEERSSELVRLAPTPRGEYKQILLSNLDQIVLVFSCAHPSPKLRMLDRFLVICEKQKIPPVIVANKVDLLGIEQAQQQFSAYPSLGYPLVFTSVQNELGIEELHDLLKGKISGLVGPSGVGKSSLLNAIQPELGLAVRAVSESSEKGRHTTVVRELFPLLDGGYVADLPGLRTLSLWDTLPEELDGYFPEMRPLVEHCQFSDCTHRELEPGCAVRAAVDAGTIHPERYISYLRMRYGDEEDMGG